MSTESDGSPIDPDRLEPLGPQQRILFQAQLSEFADYLREEGKDPKRQIGYAEKSVSVRISRFQQLVEWIWEDDRVTEIVPEHADRVLDALDKDEIRKDDGDRFSESSKRKFVDVLRNWLEFRGFDWEPEISFSDEPATNHADPFTKAELRDLTQAAMTYKSIPTYNNLSPDERDRWKAHIAQELGKPKSEVSPEDWDRINTCWKIPSLIRSTREAGWRPDLVARMKVNWYDPGTQTIYIPEGEAPKNDVAWEQEITRESALMLDNWLEQRSNIERYDDRDEIWLNRAGNPYTSGSLNRLLRNLMDEANIDDRGRNLVWYSFRHSVGTYVYDEYQDLKIVADVLRQKSTSSASRYVHPTKELRREAASVM